MDPKPEFVPPYGVPWSTVLGAVDKMEKEGIPNRVDRSYLGTQAGTIQTYLIGALKSFGLIGENAVPTDELQRLVAAPEEERKQRIFVLLHSFYPAVVELGKTKATQGELEELFDTEWGQKGATKVKAIRFYLAAAQYAGVQLSPLWKSPRASATRPRKGRKIGVKPDAAMVEAPIGALGPIGDDHRVILSSGATLTLIVSERLLKLPKTERNDVLEIIDQLDKLDVGTLAPTVQPADESDPEPDS